MAMILGKRKRRIASEDVLDGSESPHDPSDYQEALRRHFEATFEPVQTLTLVSEPLSSSKASSGHNFAGLEPGGSDLESDWNGVSDVEEVQVVSHTRTILPEDDEVILKTQRKRFMSSKPPTSLDTSNSKNTAQTAGNANIKSASSLTAEDLALQRLLSESHLLSGSTTSNLLPSLKARQVAQDLRLQNLGAKKSINALGSGNMPMAVRKGIENKKQLKERGRRKEAKEAGVVLERLVRSSAGTDKRRRRVQDVGAPAVGKWKGGTLMLGKKDVAEIEGQRLTSDFGKKGRGGRKGRRR